MRRLRLASSTCVALALLAAGLVTHASTGAPSVQTGTLTDVDGIEVGHAVMPGRPTGCTVVLLRQGAVAAVDVRGAAPGTRETDLLDPLNSVQMVHAIVLAGGSAFGLDSATGVMRYLDEQGIGFKVGRAAVPIVPAAILMDLGIGDQRIRPDAGCGYRAVTTASRAAVPQGNVGAGAGATVGKARGLAHAMKGGLGSSSIRLDDGTVVAALVAVNAWGDVVDPATGRLVAGVRTDEGTTLADARMLMRKGGLTEPFGGNTTLVVVGTNARLTKTQAALVARMAHDGIARAVIPSHTPYDGDTVFAVATGTLRAAGDADAPAPNAPAPNLARLGGLAADAVADAILAAVRAAESLPRLPAVRDLGRALPPAPDER
jgi:L-aminopeptidase/D-esterase-like protein